MIKKLKLVKTEIMTCTDSPVTFHINFNNWSCNHFYLDEKAFFNTINLSKCKSLTNYLKNCPINLLRIPLILSYSLSSG